MNIEISPSAKEQIFLMKENDPYLEGKEIRITIEGKDCDGFIYAIGFDDFKDNDLIVKTKEEINVILDPFCTEYLKNLTIEYQADFLNNKEGLVVINRDQKEVSGKFWKSSRNN